MKSHARVVVIGGGAVGVSTLYHLAHKGWSDVVLVERAELTAGSTWHAAGLLPLFNMSYTVGQLHKYSVDLYKRLPAETGQDVSFHVTGNLRLATCRERMDEYQKYCGTANTIGVPFQVISPQEVKRLWPLLELGNGADTPNIIGALYHPDDGHIAPADLTMALRKGARARGADIYEQTEVTAVRRTPSGEWHLSTNKGDIVAEHVVCATGNYARQTGRLFGINVPSIPVEHQYIVYDESPELKSYRQGGGRELVCCANPTNPTTCVKSAWAGSSAPMRPVHRPDSRTACPTGSARACSKATWNACCRMSRRRSAVCRRSPPAGSKTS